MEEKNINMYKNDIVGQKGKTQILQVLHKGRVYFFRHLFSGSERCEPVPPVRGRTLDRDEHFHPIYHAVLYSEGRGCFNYCGEKLDFEPGLLVVTSPNEPHKFGPHTDCGSPVTYKHFTFDLVSEDGLSLELPFNELLSLYSGVGYARMKVPYRLDPMAYHVVLESLESVIAQKMEHESHPDLTAASAIMKLLSNLTRVFCMKTSIGDSVFDERLLRDRKKITWAFDGRYRRLDFRRKP